VPAKQDEHVDAKLAPPAAENNPAAQLVQVDAPGAVWYWPGTQFKQTLLLAPARVPNRPTRQLTQAVAPVEIWYWPATQVEQTLLLAPGVVPN
jgi:hypothetical protein